MLLGRWTAGGVDQASLARVSLGTRRSVTFHLDMLHHHN